MLTRSQIASLLAEIDKQESTLARQKAFLIGEDERLAAEERLTSTGTVLQKREQSSTLKGDMMTDDHAMAISKARRKRKDDPLMDAAEAVGLKTQNRLAKALGCSNATLSRYRHGRPVPEAFDKRVRELLPTWNGRWRGGIS